MCVCMCVCVRACVCVCVCAPHARLAPANAKEGAETGEVELMYRREAVTVRLLEPEPGASEKAVSALNLSEPLLELLRLSF